MFSCNGKFLAISYPMVKTRFPLTAKVVLELLSHLSSCSMQCRHIIWGCPLILRGSRIKPTWIILNCYVFHNNAFPDGKDNWMSWFAILAMYIYYYLRLKGLKNRNNLVMISWYLLIQMASLFRRCLYPSYGWKRKLANEVRFYSLASILIKKLLKLQSLSCF